jgi:hypothetical protein
LTLIGLRGLDSFEILDRDDNSWTILAEPGIGAVADDAQDPGASTAAGKSTGGAEGA